jgi:hypothetical protein
MNGMPYGLMSKTPHFNAVDPKCDMIAFPMFSQYIISYLLVWYHDWLMQMKFVVSY